MSHPLPHARPWSEASLRLLVRATLGALFIQSGLGKLGNLTRTVEFFADLHIPFPEVQAPLVATLELVGGAALLLGLLTPVFSLLLASTMFVAILTAKLPEVDGVVDLLAQEESIYLGVLLWLGTAGAGRLSVDQLLGERLGNRYPRLFTSPLASAR